MTANTSTSELALPDDAFELKAMLHEVLQTNREQSRQLEQLQARLDLLLRRLYGRQAERVDPAQMLLFADAPPQPAETKPEPEPEQPARKRRGHGRQKLPDHLPRRRVVHELPEAERPCPCCQKPRQAISSQTSEQLDYQPASLFIVEHVRLTYVCTACQKTTAPDAPVGPIGSTFATAPKPAQPIERGMAGPGLLAHVVVSKYSDHLPLNRQQEIFGRHGVHLSRKTLCDWMADCADLLHPLTRLMAERILAGRVIHTDDTSLPVQVGEGKTRDGALWVYAGDESARYVVYDFTMGRVHSGPQHFLAGFTGFLQADAFTGYDRLFGLGGMTEVACWAHARRKFYDARASDGERSHRMLGWIRQLYAVEREAGEETEKAKLDLEASWVLRKGLRQEKSLPLLTTIGEWLAQQQGKVLPKSPMGEAIGYARNHWAAFLNYTREGFLAIDNNLAERSLRAIAVGRKNWLFAGSERGGRTASVLYGMTQSCRRLGLNTFAYLRDLLTALPGLAGGELSEWLPDRWSARGRAELDAPP